MQRTSSYIVIANAQKNPWIPVIARPSINACISDCPSYYKWASYRGKCTVWTTWRLCPIRPIWYSSLTALPPNTSCNTLVPTKARSQFCLFIILTISLANPPLSLSLPTCHAASNPYAASVAACANLTWTNWYFARGFPNWCRSRAYVRVSSSAPSRAPITPQAIP